MSDGKAASTRRGFLLGLLSGAGAFAVTSIGSAPAGTPAAAGGSYPGQAEAVLFRKTDETVRYYKTLHD